MFILPPPEPALAPSKTCRQFLAGSFALAVALMFPSWSLAGDSAAPSQSKFLEGNLREEGKLNSSLKVVPMPVLNGRAGAVNIQQYAAGGTYHPGQAAPMPPKPPIQPPILSAGSGVRPVATTPAQPPPVKPPPKWDYTATPHSGIMTWTPGGGVKVIQPLGPATRPVPKPRVPAPIAKPKPNWRDIYSKTGLRPEQYYGWVGPSQRFAARPATAPVAPRVVPLMATPQLMPSAVNAAQSAPANWSEWYQRVSKAIYEQWQRSTTGPGDARVRVTVWKSHDVDCQIVDFAPAADVKRNADTETQFRERAIQCIYSLRKCEILSFPYSAAKASVTFELDLKRAVNGKSGCDFGEISEK